MRTADQHATGVRRFECKYVLGEALAERVRRYLAPYLRPDPFAARSGGRYVLTSTYLDSPTLRLHRETVEGVARRFKLRIRAYQGGGPLYLEIKRRESGTVAKTRAAVDPSCLDALLRRAATLPEDDASKGACEEFVGLMRHLAALPVVMVRYEREAHLGADPGTRVTFDRQLSAAATEAFAPRHSGAGWHAVAPGRVILELKFRDRWPSWMAACVQRLELLRVSFSKYGCALRALPRQRMIASEA